jgi:hypothetical protein
LIYDATVWFCGKFLEPRSRTVDQMVQAARSGRQNIAEGSRASATSSQTELRLMNVARSSLEELLLDYEDFLRHRRLVQWAPDDREALAVRRVPQRFKHDQTDPTDRSDLTDLERWSLYAPWLEHANNSRPRAWLTVPGNHARPTPAPPHAFRTARNAASRWCCAPPRAARMSAASFGAAPLIRTARG